MKYVTPTVIRLAQTALNAPGVADFLAAVGAPDWHTDAPTPGETLIEVVGRTCYRSFEPGLNPNVTKVRDGNAPYLANLLKQQHYSVLEHVAVTYGFVGVSRVFTHELVRHRHLAFSQESLRFVRAYLPELFRESPGAERIMGKVFSHCERAQGELADLFDLDAQDFATKKQVTSAMRRCAPIGLTTTIVATGNLRGWREVIAKRCTEHAEEEIRNVIGAVRDDLAALYPNAMGDRA